ncbi:MAG: Protocatechuate 3,4-dioxygenase beta chain (EC [uncultured Caballeronia sp.]|nr:MAG: Protocatechuate 3,4-dioxygenase beta chain (EC [uncultured Caballeronia sp.]
MWRSNHIHFSLFGSRLVTQMYLPCDPLLDLDPIFQGTPENARNRLISRFSIDTTEESYALGYEFDIVLGGANQTPTEA